jgi:hypothetical protein
MIILASLFFAFACRAGAVEPPPISLNKLSEIPVANGTPSDDFTMVAAVGESSVGVWRMIDGRQLHRISLPHIDKPDDDQGFTFYLTEFSPDNRFLLMALQDYRDFKQGEAAIYLLDLESESARRIYSTRRSCHINHGRLEKYHCPSANAAFSPDGNKILIRIESELGQTNQGEPERFSDESLLVDRDGKTLQDVKELSRQDPPAENGSYPTAVVENPTGGRISGFGADGHLLGVIRDASSCELRDLSAGKRLVFLDDCSQKDDLSFLAPGVLVSGSCSAGCAGKYWEAGTGKIRKFPKVPNNFSGALFTAAGDFAFSTNEGATHWIEIRAAPFDTVVYSTPTQSSGVGEWKFSKNGAFLLQAIDANRSALYATGLTGRVPPSVAAFAAPQIDVDSPPATKAKVDPDAYAVVIGVEKYRQDGIPAVDFAARDAQTMASYLTGAMGFDPRNVVLLTDAQATRTDLEKNLKWLSNRATAKSRVFVYYAGHGSPNPETGEGYLMPYEADPSYLDETAFPIAKLYAALGKLPTRDVTVVLDACFSGQGGRSLIAKGTRPLVSVVQSKAEPNTVVLAAAGSNQVSASFPEARHGLLTYYLLAGLGGQADANHDGKITAEELIAYVRPAVERAAKLQNVEQTPSLMSSSEAVQQPWIVLAPKKQESAAEIRSLDYFLPRKT